MREPIMKKTRKETTSREGGLYMNSNRNSKKGKRGFKKLITGAIAVAIAVVLCVTMIPQDALAATVDLDTSKKYSESLGDNESTEYAGRIWTDKSVYSDDATFDLFGGGTTTIEINPNGVDDEDFLVAFSALATSQQISGKTQAPIDVVFVVDLSGSMSNSDSNMDNNKSRISNTIDAVNDSIDALMALNEYTRVGVVGFSNTYTELLPLDRYTKVGNNTGYFSLNRTTASENYADLYVDAIGSAGNVIDETVDVEGGTNIQMGLYGGLNMLATEDSLYADVNGSQVKRIPTLILLSDGSPTYSSDGYESGGGPNQIYVESNWWTPLNNRYDGPGSSPYYGNGMKALMTGAYMKNAVDDNYGVAGTAYATNIYTIGMGITDLPNYENDRGRQYYTGEQHLAYITLNPSAHWDHNNAMANAIRAAWEEYIAGNNPSVSVNSNDTYTLSHPTSNDIYTDNNDNTDDTALKDLVDGYYAADEAAQVTSVFDNILSNIIINTPEVPTEIKGTDATVDGYITYTDPIGKYMSVKDVKSILYAGQEFTLPDGYVPTETRDGSNTIYTYKFTGTVNSSVYGNQSIEDIIITVTVEEDKDEVLTIKIPASVIPVRINTVELDKDGNPTSHTNNGAYPIRVVYSVGLQNELIDDTTGVVKVSELSQEYIENNVNEDGTVNFYSNLYTGQVIKHLHADDGKWHETTVGNATVEFEPSHSNPFYYMQEDVPIYLDSAGKNQVPATSELDDDTTYYYVSTYYHGDVVETEVIARTGRQLKQTDIIEIDGYLYREKGSPRLNRIMEFEGTKTQNATNTANDFYLPTFVDGTETEDAYDGKYVIYLGNNGVISYATGGTLAISKNVDIPDGLTGPADQVFEFKVDFNGASKLTGSFAYEVFDANGNVVNTGTISDGGTIELSDGQKVIINNIPSGTTYEVTEIEANANGFKTTSSVTDEGTTTGKIEVGKLETVAFENKYSVTPVSVTFDDVKKVLWGKPWASSDEFTFVLKSADTVTPMPDGATTIGTSHKESVVTVTNANASLVSGNDSIAVSEAMASFGAIEYSKAGVYKYEISEVIPTEEIDGVSYSAALYKVIVTVTDNGDGTLSSSVKMTKDVDDSGVTPSTETVVTTAEFKNVYEVNSQNWVPLGTKNYVDTHGTNPIYNGMFEFSVVLDEYETIQANNVASINDIKVPAKTSMEVGNTGHDIAYEAITFTQDHIGKTYVFRLTELSTYIAGMDYDESVYYAKVVVTQDTNGPIKLSITYTTENGTTLTAGKVTFSNTYTPSNSAPFEIYGDKILNGRDMNANEVFTFKLTGVSDNAVALLGTTVYEETVTGGKDGLPNRFKFDGIVFTAPGTYVFEVDEVDTGTANGVTFDEHKTTVTVNVKDVNGTLVATPTYDNGTVSTDTEKAVFINEYEAAGVSVTVPATKYLSGKPLVDGEFFFDVEPQDGAPLTSRGTLVIVPADADGTANDTLDGKAYYSSSENILNNVVYTVADDYEYLISEQIPTGATKNSDGTYTYRGTTYDPTLYKLVVSVDDDKSGQLSASWKLSEKTGEDASGNPIWTELANNSEIVFVNDYTVAPEVYVVPTFTKELIGGRATPLQANEFEFKMSVVEGNDANVILPNPNPVSNDAAGNIAFNPVTFTAAGTYKLQIVENDVSDPTITKSSNKITAVFVVTDNLDGTLSVERRNIDGAYNFVNEYKTSGTFDLNIAKKLENRTWQSPDKFDFEVVILDPETKAAADAGLIEFSNAGSTTIPTVEIDSTITPDANNNRVKTSPVITIKAPTKDGEAYEFVVREIAGNIAGVHYDDTSYVVAVTATDNSNGTLTISTTVDGQPFDWENGMLQFTNKYEANSVELSGHQNLKVNKVFTGRPDDAWFDTDEFTFVLEKYGSTENDDTVTLPENASGLKVTNANKAYAHFGNIKFSKEGTYFFKIYEVNEQAQKAYIKYDNAYYIVKVDVGHDISAAELKITNVAYTKNGTTEVATSIDFANKYSVTEKTVPVEITKVLEGRNWSANDAFEFKIEAANDVAIEGVVNGTVVMPTNNLVITNSGSTTSASGNFEITFKKPGTYHFHVTEVEGADDNITYSTHTSHVTIVVNDDGAGGLDVGDGNLTTATVTSITGGTFTNIFTPIPIDVPISGSKVLNGRTLNAGEFRFRIDAITENAPMPAVHNHAVANDDAGNINFGTIRYTHEGTYQYRISEIMTPVAGVTYDTVDVIATVQVSKDANGTLVPTVTYAKEDGSGTEFVFNNTYTTTPTDPVEISAYKSVTPTEGNSFTMAGDDFSFEIEPAASNPDSATPVVPQQIVKNAADGTVLFKNAVYSEPGTYVYTVHEVSSNRGGITLDESVYTVTVVVRDDASVAQLQADVTITNAAGTEVNAMTFDNGYNPTETSVIFHGHKKLLGGHKDLQAEEFEFQLKDAAGNVIGTAKNTETGLFQFDAITYTAPTQAGAPLVYTITEVAGNEAGVAYDATSYTVKVTVVDENGVLKANVEGITNTDGTPIVVFENTYIPGAEFVNNIGGNKVFTGRDLTEGEFEFVLLDKDAKEVAIAKNTAEGTFAFDNVKFEKAGTYNFTIVEKDMDALGVTYDLNTTYGVEVVIKDIGGQLDTESITYYKDGVAISADKVVFTNFYAAVNPATIQLGAAKTLTGRELKAGEFTFLLTGSDGTALTAVNGADGSVLFDELKFTEAGTYTYVITEAKGNDADVTYDGSKYTVTVVVKDDLKGNYVAEITSITESVAGREVAASAVTFENSYTAPVPEGTSPKTNDIFNIWMLLAVIAVAGFGFFGATAYSRRS